MDRLARIQELMPLLTQDNFTRSWTETERQEFLQLIQSQEAAE